MKVQTRLQVFEAEQFLLDKKPYPAGVSRVGGEDYGSPELWWRFENTAIRPGWWILTNQDGAKWACSDGEFRSWFETVGGKPSPDEVDRWMTYFAHLAIDRQQDTVLVNIEDTDNVCGVFGFGAAAHAIRKMVDAFDLLRGLKQE